MRSAGVVFVFRLSVLIAFWTAASTIAQQPEQSSVSPVGPMIEAAHRETMAEMFEITFSTDLMDLQDRAEKIPLPLETDRNPFTLKPDVFMPTQPAVARPSASEAVAVGLDEPPRAELALAGIAFGELPDRSGSVGIGIFSDQAGQTYIAKVGELVVSGYRVEFVGATSVTLIDETGDRLRLVLP